MVVVFIHCSKCLKKAFSQVRVATVKLIDCLSTKLHVIRLKLSDELVVFIELTNLGYYAMAESKIKVAATKEICRSASTFKAMHNGMLTLVVVRRSLGMQYRFLEEHELVDFNRFQVTNHKEVMKS
jgi:hypothetical protein